MASAGCPDVYGQIILLHFVPPLHFFNSNVIIISKRAQKKVSIYLKIGPYLHFYSAIVENINGYFAIFFNLHS